MKVKVPKMFKQVSDFMRRTRELGGKIVIGDRKDPTFPEEDQLRLRVDLIVEEAIEFAEACGYSVVCAPSVENGTRHVLTVQRWTWGEPMGVGGSFVQAARKPDFILAIDALCDLLYVVFGAFVNFGLNPTPHFDEVHRSNMTKLGGDAKIRDDGRVMKSSSFEPPRLLPVLAEEIEKRRRKPAA